MIAVEQRQMSDAKAGKSGDCWKCCIASILELDYDDVPHFVQMEEDGEIDSYWNATQEWLKERGYLLATFVLHGDTPQLMHGNRKPAWHFSAPGHWIAAVVSPRVHGVTGKPLSHVVVMHGRDVVWDPHPLRDQGHRGFTEAFLLVHP